ncbi:hypothetical protein BJY52DRAFT_1209866 [Lactarius psammicola]|nr:hypothetical protein BJY52DRAFT_1209866 [Lactarius psammicola]
MSSALSTVLPSDLSKLNVSQLKAICKERRIVGYSKLGKAALIRKIAELVPSAPLSTSTQKTSSNTETATQVTMGIPFPPVVPLRTSRSAALSDAHISSGPPATQAPTVVLASQQPSDTQIVPMKKNCTPLALAASISKRLPSETSQGQVPATPLAKKRKVVGFSSATISLSEAGGSTRPSSSAPTGHLISPVVPVPPASCGPALSPELAGARRLVRTQPIGTSGKRFKPLEIMRPPAVRSVDIENARMGLGSHDDEGGRTNAQLTAIRHWHLDFPASMAPPALSPITLPPSLAERRLVHRWTVILSGLSEKERFRCCFVSKLIRYAVYSSAYYILCKDFSGKRLSIILQQYGPSSLRMNFWPYLRQREQEVLERKNAVMSSFLFPAFRGPGDLISARLWASPDNEKQLTVALRFLLTRLWFGLSTVIGCATSVRTNWLYDVATDVEETVKGEIWYVTTRNSRSGCLQSFHVLEATCEVLGFMEDARIDDHLRADWATSCDGPITQNTSEASAGTGSAVRLRWARKALSCARSQSATRSHASLVTGKQQGSHAAAALSGELTPRSSLSGSWMSAPQMAQEFAGLAQRGTPQVPVKVVSNLSLFLPAQVFFAYCPASLLSRRSLALRHHHVESTHLTTTGGSLLHPALAVVQTPAREYYILRDNGMEVGCEEDGVARVWMRILGCNARGEPVERAGVSFEELKAYIQDL